MTLSDYDLRDGSRRRRKAVWAAVPAVVIGLLHACLSLRTPNQSGVAFGSAWPLARRGSRRRGGLLAAAAEGSERPRIVFLGSPSCVEVVLQALWDSQEAHGCVPFSLSAVVSQPPKRVGNKNNVKTPVHVLAEKLQVAQIWTPDSAKDEAFLADLESLRPDLCITAAYGQYLPKRFLAAPRLGTINLHPSLLPRWRGASPVQRALEAGDDETGITILYTVSKMDAGPIIVQQKMPLTGSEVSTSLLEYLFKWGSQLLVEEALPRVLREEVTMETAQKQDEGLVIKAPLIAKEEGKLWPHNETALQMRNKVRGFDSWPGTTLPVACSGSAAPLQGFRLRVSQAEVVPASSLPELPGDVQQLVLVPGKDGKADAVALRPALDAEHALLLREFQFPGKSEVNAATFAKGYMKAQPARWTRPEEELELSQASGSAPAKPKKMRGR